MIAGALGAEAVRILLMQRGPQYVGEVFGV